VAVHQDTGESRDFGACSVCFAAGRILNATNGALADDRRHDVGIGKSALIEENHVDPRYGSFVAQDLASYPRRGERRRRRVGRLVSG